jgi:hypothetical protein
MTLKPWITSLALLSVLTATGLAFAQQPQAQPQAEPQSPLKDRTPIVNGTMTYGADGKPIMQVNAPTVDRTPIVNGTMVYGADGKPITTTTNFGMR